LLIRYSTVVVVVICCCCSIVIHYSLLFWYLMLFWVFCYSVVVVLFCYSTLLLLFILRGNCVVAVVRCWFTTIYPHLMIVTFPDAITILLCCCCCAFTHLLCWYDYNSIRSCCTIVCSRCCLTVTFVYHCCCWLPIPLFLRCCRCSLFVVTLYVVTGYLFYVALCDLRLLPVIVTHLLRCTRYLRCCSYVRYIPLLLYVTLVFVVNLFTLFVLIVVVR